MALHLVNTIAAAGGQLQYDELQRVLRVFYQHPWVEPTVLVGALTAHVVSRYGTELTSSNPTIPLTIIILNSIVQYVLIVG